MYAAFSGPPGTGVCGTVTFEARGGGDNNGVDVGIQVQSDGLPITTGHKWHVHAGGLADTTDCSTALGHWDPSGVEVTTGLPPISHQLTYLPYLNLAHEQY